MSDRLKCKEFGKEFKKDDGTFMNGYTAKCKANKLWSITEITWPCECK